MEVDTLANIERWHHAGICPESGKNCPMGGHAPGTDTVSESEVEYLERQLAGAVEALGRIAGLNRYAAEGSAQRMAREALAAMGLEPTDSGGRYDKDVGA